MPPYHPTGKADINAFSLATMAVGKHLFPFRTEKLSPPAPMVLPWKRGGRVGRRQGSVLKKAFQKKAGTPFLLPLCSRSKLMMITSFHHFTLPTEAAKRRPT